MQLFEKLEEDFGELMETPKERMVACSSGTAALHLALETLKAENSWICGRFVVPNFTMVACARAVSMASMGPVFAEVLDNGTIDPDYSFSHLANIKGVMPVHLYGRKAETNFETTVVEDLAEAHGILPNPNSQAACWSFYKNKIIAGEEGGMVWFRTKEQAQIARELRCLGMTSNHDFNHRPRGNNYRLSNCHAELILKSLEDYEENLAKRIQIEGWFNEEVPIEMHRPEREVPWVYDLLLPPGITNGQVVPELNKMGVEARYSFKLMSRQDEYSSPIPRVYPISERLSRRTFYFPICPDMKRSTVVRYVDSYLQVLDSLNVPV